MNLSNGIIISEHSIKSKFFFGYQVKSFLKFLKTYNAGWKKSIKIKEKTIKKKKKYAIKIIFLLIFS